MQRFSKLSVALLLILCLRTNGIFVIAEGDEGISELLQTMVQYLEIGTGDFDQYELTGYVGSSGYAQDTVYFGFDLRPGNQTVSVSYGNEKKSFIVVSMDNPMAVLIAFERLLPHFEEIQAALPDTHKLIFRFYAGEVGSESYSLDITEEVFAMYFAE